MPSFYPTGAPAHLPVLTPEYASRAAPKPYRGYQDHQNAYAPYTGAGTCDLSSLASPYDPYNALAAPSATLFGPSNTFGTSVHTNPQLGAPMLHPMRVNDQYATDGIDSRRHHHQSIAVPKHQPKEDRAVGGVSAKLDYEMEIMTDFVSEMATGMYELCISRICLADIDLLRSIKPGLKAPATFRKWVLHVLNATRLPSATILTSLHYLSLRVRELSKTGNFNPTEQGLSQLLTIALILGSKFLDDNTFQNKSWAQVSSINITELNRAERDWLSAFDHRLHYHPQTPEGFKSWQDRWISFQVRSVTTTLAPFQALDTNVQRRRSARQTASPASYAQQYSKPSAHNYMDHSVENQYPTPTYSSYDPWHPQRSAVEKSPSTAPHTGPTTPEYYGAPGSWSQESYSQRALYGYAGMPTAAPQSAGCHIPYGTPFMHDLPWTGHGPFCGCAYCPRPAPYLMPSRYGPTVAG